jgi:hypothetical protein
VSLGDYSLIGLLIILGILADHFLNGGKVWNSMFSWRDTHARHELSPYARYRGQQGLVWWDLGQVVSMKSAIGDVSVQRGTIETPTTRYARDENEFFVPMRAVYRWNMQPFDIIDRDTITASAQKEIERLKSELSIARGERDMVRGHFLDFNSKLFVKVGEWRKDLGTAMSSPFMGSRFGSGFRYSQPGGEGGEGGDI